jgi:hypothetical protein
MSKFLKFVDETCGDKKKKRKRKGQIEEAKKQNNKQATQLLNTVKGWTDDIQVMIDNNNYDNALKSVRSLKTKVLKDLEKEVANLAITKGLKKRKI